MKFKRTVNQFRKAVFRLFTRNILSTQMAPDGDRRIERVLIIRPNHRLGNLLLITPLVQEVTDLFPEATIDLFVKGGIAPSLFANYGNIGRIIQLPKRPFKNPIQYLKGWLTLKRARYDLVINAVSNSSSGKVAARLASAPYTIAGEISTEITLKFPDHEHIALRPVYSLRYHFSQIGYKVAWEKMQYLNVRLSSEEHSAGRKLLNSLTHNIHPTIALYTYATGDKCYPPSFWRSLYEWILGDYPGYNVVEVLPVENVSQLSFAAPSFYSRNVREIASLIANTSLFISADSGIMHLASAAHTPTIGLFSVTDEKIYRPYNDKSLAVHINGDSERELLRQAIRKILGTSEKRPSVK